MAIEILVLVEKKAISVVPTSRSALPLVAGQTLDVCLMMNAWRVRILKQFPVAIDFKLQTGSL